MLARLACARRRPPLQTTDLPPSSIARALPAPTALTPPETYLPRLLRPLRSHPRARLLARLTPNHLVPHSSRQATRPVEAAQATRSSSGARLRRLVIIPTIILDDPAAGAAAPASHAACTPADCLSLVPAASLPRVHVCLPLVLCSASLPPSPACGVAHPCPPEHGRLGYGVTLASGR